ncbi:MAG TPA: hypothetical protein VMV74_10915 [Bacteroidales bacterium]|nr:hypothetical protein [Bacteroidales bacterium]
MIEGDPPYFGGRHSPQGHPKEGKIMGPRMGRIVADWRDKVFYDVNGGIFAFAQVLHLHIDNKLEEYTRALAENDGDNRPASRVMHIHSAQYLS